jgi:cation diffusion facilitator family transporter
MATGESNLVIYGALAANVAIAAAKYLAAGVTGSAGMLAEAIHSTVDSGNGLLLMLGIRLSKRPPDDNHPYGHGAEIYFWALMVAVMIFGVGGGISVYEGILHLMERPEISDPLWNYIVLGTAFVAEGASWMLARRELRSVQRSRSLWQTIRQSKDPRHFVIFLEDSAALVGILIAFAGVALGQALGVTWTDAVASIVIGLLLAAVAVALVIETRGLLLGESADPETIESLRTIVRRDPAVVAIKKPLTRHLGPDHILLCLDIQFDPLLSAEQVTQAVDRIESAILQKHPQVRQIFLEADKISATGSGSALTPT